MPNPSVSSTLPARAQPSGRGRLAGFSLFWRTFFLLAVLLVASMLAWLQALRAMELEPRAIQTAAQIASLVNLSRAALVHADAINRVSLIKTMSEQEGVRIVPREPSDRYEALDEDESSRRIAEELTARLGDGTVVARQVNQEEGLWIGFLIEGDAYWLQTDRARFRYAAGRTWIVWLMVVAALSLGGAALIAGLINRPLKQLSLAAGLVREGEFNASTLDEGVSTPEIRAVNTGFNRMTRKLAQMEQDRAIMLAGISHDLRTPLARLRLETELSVADAQAREHMASDIAQLDAIIDKFLDYARPGKAQLNTLSLSQVVDDCLYSLGQRTDVQTRVDLPSNLYVRADPVELGRVLANLLENAARYGRRPDDGAARVDITAQPEPGWVKLTVRDHGPGVSTEQLSQLTQPFYRGEAARTAAKGAGLGLSIVEKAVEAMGGSLELGNARSGGFQAELRLLRADGPDPAAPG